MTNAIASVDWVAVAPGGDSRPVRLRLGVPSPDPGGGWACPLEYHGPGGPVRHPLYGEDALQALCLALGFVASVLGRFVADGGRLLDGEDGTEVPLEAYFGCSAPPRQIR